MTIDNDINIIHMVRFCVVVIGLVGNFISFVVFSRNAFRKNSINVYCRALALCDSVILVVQFCTLVPILFFDNDIFSSSNTLCKLSYYILTGFPPISGWILVAFSIDKVMCVLYPYRYEFLRKTRFQISIIAIINVLNLICYLSIPINLNNAPATAKNPTQVVWVCSLKNLNFYKALSVFYLLETCLVPFVIMFITTIITVKALFSSRIRLESTLEKNREMRLRRAKDLKFAINSVALNVLYVFLQTPICLSFILNIGDRETYLLIVNISGIFYYLNFSISFFVNLASNSIFKRECLTWLGFRFMSVESTI